LAKRILIALLALLVALGGGWLWGSLGRWEQERARERAQLQADLLVARSLLLDARLELYSVNFGNASRHLEQGRQVLRRASEQLAARDAGGETKTLELALLKIDEAQSLAGKLDPAANSRAAEAAQAVAALLASEAIRE
jgi:hypothetical protein